MKTTSGDASESSFRPEIEGLRAVAALLVATYHIWLGRVSGGVDVFFVVSSFLITTGLLGQVERTGGVAFGRFWARLVKRLVPAALIVLCAVIVGAVLILPKSGWQTTLLQVGAAALYMENWLLAHNSVDYLAQHESVSPVQHFWALSIQGQFYLLWPVLIAIAAFVAARFTIGVRQAALAIFAAVFAISLAYSIHLTARNQPLAYFHTAARAWEFSMGAILALILPRLNVPVRLRILAGWIGLIAILSCGMLLHVSTVFPGYAALWPTLAAVLIIVAGTTGSRFGADRLLASRPLVALGGMSYCIYLWHFPILVFCRDFVAPGSVGILLGAGILISSVLLAFLTTRFIETPVRASSIGKRSPAPVFALQAACLAVVGVGLLGWQFELNRERRNSPKTIAGVVASYPGAHVYESGLHRVSAQRMPVFPGPFIVEHDRDFLPTSKCIHTAVPHDRLECPMGSPGSRFTVAVVGGSHSSQWLPALDGLGQALKWRVVAYTRNNCPFYSGDGVGEKKTASCPQWNEDVIGEVIALHPDFVFSTSTRFDDDLGEVVPEGYIAAWRRLEAAGITVVALRDNPDFEFDVSACVELHGRDAAQCALNRKTALVSPSPAEALVDPPRNVRFIDLSSHFCGPEVCLPVAGNVLIYRHLNHITATYVRTLIPALGRALENALDLPRVPETLFAEHQPVLD